MEADVFPLLIAAAVIACVNGAHAGTNVW